MRALTIAALACLLASCGDDTEPVPDSTSSIDAPAIDAPVADAAAGTPDAAPADASGLGKLCSTTAPDASALGCPEGLVCCATGTNVCRYPDECQGSPGYVVCTSSAGCFSGRICCEVGGAMFCTKQDACAAYGGTVVP